MRMEAQVVAVSPHGVVLPLGVAKVMEVHPLGAVLAAVPQLGAAKVLVLLLLGVVLQPGVTNQVGAVHPLGRRVVNLMVPCLLGVVPVIGQPTAGLPPGEEITIIKVQEMAELLHGVTKTMEIGLLGTTKEISQTMVVTVHGEVINHQKENQYHPRRNQ
ncbi:hypothetical protein R008_M10951 [Saccharomyces cerevisiae R008]|uniref:Putative uncharacterized protein YML009W-B n=2 Tax=Saccharomyces cerevisiae TaxID=4932 RepID=YM009_YEAST|nr:RecName: Full=Putative uncharacterized protein YML009W-B [Saccharomyces cerevisiae S288C]pir/S69872/ hypothetical protein YML009w-b - yeast (Saccharomyces cerevisiae) [Saccharomyces cerevisiae]AAT93318.1 YML010W-A [Saccharomyces cerevisiae]EWG83924.1 hypothetical protein R008_M10951 [Saccharomyces cerevisiae R008]CAY81812.1 EC1118_1M3_1442p [Saccharomyces cerevisiae EC1118]